MTTPAFRLAPGSGWRPPADDGGGGFRNSRWDRAALAVTVNPSWLLAPLFARDAGGLAPSAGPGAPEPGALDPVVDALPVPPDAAFVAASATSDWPAWWDAALAYRPGTPAPRPEELIAGSPDLRALWAALGPVFARWAAALPAPLSQEGPRRVERDALSGFAARNGRDPGRWAVRILQIPVSGRYLYAPDQRRIVVSAALRYDAEAYPDALAAELPRHL